MVRVIREQPKKRFGVNHRLIGVVLFVIGIFISTLGVVALTNSISNYIGYTNGSYACSPFQRCLIGPSIEDLEISVVWSAVVLVIGITSLIGGGFLLLRRPVITHHWTPPEITR
jgi:hypothetical protein